MLRFLKNLIQLMLSPGHAWEDISNEDAPPEKLISGGLYPLMAIMLITAVVNGAFAIGSFDLVRQLQIALAQFIALFIALYAGRTLIETFLPRYNETGENDPVGAATVAVYATGIMTLIQIVENLIPVELIVIKFLPAFAAVIVWKAQNYLDLLPEHSGLFMVIAIGVLIGPVLLINLVMGLLIA
ncbi:MAG: hypothetical protein K2K84_06365 [Muribaculaceae bacterium]|nr:hypothetical protein [Muribaculaceae bacterium]